MPKIIQNIDQVKALKSISNDLTTVETIDKITGAGKKAAVFSISVKAGAKSARETSVEISQKNAARLLQILAAERAMKVKEIQTLAAKYNIELSDEDIQICQGDKAATEAKPAADEADA